MRVFLTSKRFFWITGLPKSGTTILNNFFNSLDNGLSFSEPLTSVKNGLRIDDKILDKIVISNEEFMHEAVALLNNSPQYDLLGVKEAFWINSKIAAFLSQLDLINLIIIVFREPKANFSSWIRFHPSSDIHYFIRCYKELFDLANKKQQGRFIARFTYEQFCESPITAINNSLKGMLQIEGPVNIHQTMFSSGDPIAMKSSEINRASLKYEDVLSAWQISLLDDELLPLYASMKTYDV